MTEFNTIYDDAKKMVGQFRHGSAWSKNPRVHLGGYDHGNEGSISDSLGREVAYFKGCIVKAMNGEVIGSYCEVPFSAFSGDETPRMEGATIKRLEVRGRLVGWCIGRSEAACAAIFLLFSGFQRKAATDDPRTV